MIVRDSQVDTALAYLNAIPHPLAITQFNLMKAENATKRAYAQAYLNQSGTVEARKQRATLDPTYIAAQDAEAEAAMKMIDHREQKNGAEKIIDVWRTENANIRAAERVR